MDLNEFVVSFADQFDDTDPSEIQASTKFHDLEEWSSLTGMGVIALAKTEYDKTITGKELRKCVTVEDVFNLITSK
jgi:acyl carrier protein